MLISILERIGDVLLDQLIMQYLQGTKELIFHFKYEKISFEIIAGGSFAKRCYLYLPLKSWFNFNTEIIVWGWDHVQCTQYEQEEAGEVKKSKNLSAH